MSDLKVAMLGVSFAPPHNVGDGARTELLSMAEVLQCLLNSHAPLKEQDFAEKRRNSCMEGELVCHHQKV